ncbi:hypothetical protein NPIL_191441, partial [Nephila pilipes]
YSKIEQRLANCLSTSRFDATKGLLATDLVIANQVTWHSISNFPCHTSWSTEASLHYGVPPKEHIVSVMALSSTSSKLTSNSRHDSPATEAVHRIHWDKGNRILLDK